jgi:GTP-binding protein HflX
MKFHSKPIAEHAEVPLADEGRLEALITRWTEREAPLRPNTSTNRCYVVSVRLRGQVSNIAEIIGLVEAQGDSVVGQEQLDVVRPDARTLIRGGVADRIGRTARGCGANLLVFDANPTPSQARNLEDASGLPVCDREAVILNVFQRHAKTRRARIQVEIAHLQYLRPRIRGIGLSMDQQAGGMMAARGPGETASELLARRLDGRLADLRRALERLKGADELQRKHRARCRRVVLVGYTNAGKTSLMNALTRSELSVRDRPFETLDTTSRCISRHGGDVLLSDTVGFIRRLPERLFASFESTLAEAREASLLLVVVDASDPEVALHLETTRQMLAKLGAESVPRFVVFNKADRLRTRLAERTLEEWSGGHGYAVLSSRDPEAVSRLGETMLGIVRGASEQREVFVPYGAARATRLVYACCRVLRATPEQTGMKFMLQGQAHVLAEVVDLAEESAS